MFSYGLHTSISLFIAFTTSAFTTSFDNHFAKNFTCIILEYNFCCWRIIFISRVLIKSHVFMSDSAFLVNQIHIRIIVFTIQDHCFRLRIIRLHHILKTFIEAIVILLTQTFNSFLRLINIQTPKRFRFRLVWHVGNISCKCFTLISRSINHHFSCIIADFLTNFLRTGEVPILAFCLTQPHTRLIIPINNSNRFFIFLLFNSAFIPGSAKSTV